MTAKINKLQAIAAFARVAEEGGFTAAAARLGTSVSNVTKIICRLEEDLGARLFNRTTRSLALTECGELYYQRCVRIMADIEEAEAVMRETTSTVEGQVRIVTPYSFGRDQLIPALPEFYRRYPSIALEMTFRGGEIDIVKEGFDLAIRIGELNDSGLIRRVLLRTPMVTVAAPSYLQRCGVPRTPNDLRAHNCIIGRRVGSEWHYHKDGRRISVPVSGNLHLDNSDGLREATVAGLGIGHASARLFGKDIEQGTLVTILDDHEQDGVPVSVLYSAKRHLPAKVTTVIEFLTELTRDSSLPGPTETVAANKPLLATAAEPLQGAAAIRNSTRFASRQTQGHSSPSHRLRQMTIAAAKISRPE